MTLPASGPLTFSDIQTEFGGSNPIGLNEYYAGGGLVPAGTSGTYGAVPSSGQISVQNFYGTSAVIPVYIEEVFSTWLFNTSTPSDVTVTNGINLSGNGGLVWNKLRSTDASHQLYDTVRGGDNQLQSNTANGQTSSPPNAVQFGSNGFTWLRSGGWDTNTAVSWTFRKQPKFFDIQAFSTNYLGNTTISHNLGSTPGCILIKKYSGSQDWKVYHRSVGTDFILELNSTSTSISSPGWITVSSTTIGFPGSALDGSSLYVAYIFAHDAGGFGVTGTDNVVSCGSFTTNGSGVANVNLGYEPQWVLYKRSDSSAGGGWGIVDSMRGFTANSSSNDNLLFANLSDAETQSTFIQPNSTGFSISNGGFASRTYIYIAIRRGPMKVPTDATKVFQVSTTSTARLIGDIYDSNLNPPDLYIFQRLTPFGAWWSDRLRGWKLFSSRGTDGEEVSNYVAQSGKQDELVYVGNWDSALPYANWYFRRAPGVFDTVCYTGTGVARTVTHNLTVVPELLITKCRNGVSLWMVYDAAGGNTKRLILNGTNIYDVDISYWNNTTPTASVFTLGNSAELNASGSTYVAYLFATCAGVSKVGTYTGTGALQTVNCGFASGVRWVLIKRTDSTGGWYVYDSARGITSGNDPYLFLNNSDGEVTGTNYVDTTSVGFQVTAAAPAGLNASGGTYLFLAIA